MMTKSRLSNPLALAVLVLLFERPIHPYEMAATLKERHKEASIKLRYGSLYTVIELLLREGYIVAKETVREGRRPERTVYALTPIGEVEMRDWLSDLQADPIPVAGFPGSIHSGFAGSITVLWPLIIAELAKLRSGGGAAR